MTPGDWNKIQAAFENPKEARSNEGSITFLEQSYKPIRCDNDSLYAKHVITMFSSQCVGTDWHYYNQDKQGLVICRTNAHCIITAYDANMYPSVAVGNVLF